MRRIDYYSKSPIDQQTNNHMYLNDYLKLQRHIKGFIPPMIPVQNDELRRNRFIPANQQRNQFYPQIFSPLHQNEQIQIDRISNNVQNLLRPSQKLNFLNKIPFNHLNNIGNNYSSRKNQSNQHKMIDFNSQRAQISPIFSPINKFNVNQKFTQQTANLHYFGNKTADKTIYPIKNVQRLESNSFLNNLTSHQELNALFSFQGHIKYKTAATDESLNNSIHDLQDYLNSMKLENNLRRKFILTNSTHLNHLKEIVEKQKRDQSKSRQGKRSSSKNKSSSPPRQRKTKDNKTIRDKTKSLEPNKQRKSIIKKSTSSVKDKKNLKSIDPEQFERKLRQKQKTLNQALKQEQEMESKCKVSVLGRLRALIWTAFYPIFLRNHLRKVALQKKIDSQEHIVNRMMVVCNNAKEFFLNACAQILYDILDPQKERALVNEKTGKSHRNSKSAMQSITTGITLVLTTLISYSKTNLLNAPVLAFLSQFLTPKTILPDGIVFDFVLKRLTFNSFGGIKPTLQQSIMLIGEFLLIRTFINSVLMEYHRHSRLIKRDKHQISDRNIKSFASVFYSVIMDWFRENNSVQENNQAHLPPQQVTQPRKIIIYGSSLEEIDGIRNGIKNNAPPDEIIYNLYSREQIRALFDQKFVWVYDTKQLLSEWLSIVIQQIQSQNQLKIANQIHAS